MSHGFKAKYDTLTIERHADLARGNVATIRIDRLEAFNAVNEQMHEDLACVFRAAQYDKADVFVLTGTGGAFCAGGDIDWFQEMIDEPKKFADIGADAVGDGQNWRPACCHGPSGWRWRCADLAATYRLQSS